LSVSLPSSSASSNAVAASMGRPRPFKESAMFCLMPGDGFSA
jgi:hypothetical protein